MIWNRVIPYQVKRQLDASRTFGGGTQNSPNIQRRAKEEGVHTGILTFTYENSTDMVSDSPESGVVVEAILKIAVRATVEEKRREQGVKYKFVQGAQ